MKHTLTLSILTLGLSVSAFASNAACGASGASLLSYINAGPCDFTGNGQSYTLSDYTFLAVGLLANTANASDINVTTSIGANGPNVTFTPDSNLEAGGLLSTLTYLFGFDLVSNVPSIGFAQVNLSEHSALVGGVSVGLVGEQDCYGGLLPVNVASLGNGGLACTTGGLSVGTNINLTPGVNAQANPAIVFTGFSNSVDVLKEVSLTAAIGGSASVSSIGQSFTTELASVATPEPASLFLGGCGLIALAIFRPRKMKKVESK